MSAVPLTAPSVPLTKTGPTVTVWGRTIPVMLPKLSDPRLKLSATILTLTILGQTILSFQVSLPQIFVCVVLSALIDIVMTYRSAHVLVWPARPAREPSGRS